MWSRDCSPSWRLNKDWEEPGVRIGRLRAPDAEGKDSDRKPMVEADT
jgi:hypothetical protein